MGTANVAFFQSIDNGQTVARLPAALSENVTTSASAASSSVCPEGCNLVQLSSDATERFSVDADASATGVRLPADTVICYNIAPGQYVSLINE